MLHYSASNDHEVLESSQSPISVPPPVETSISTKRYHRGYKSMNQSSKKRRLNHIINHSPHDFLIDLCDDDDDESIIILNDNIKRSAIKSNDKSIFIWGISIGTFCHHWTETHKNRPKLIFNKHRASFDIYLQSNTNDYVKINIKISTINNLIIPKDPSFFQIINSNKAIPQYLNVLFIDLRESLPSYPWLSTYFSPNSVSNKKAFIMIVIDAYNMAVLTAIISSKYKCNMLQRYIMIDNVHKKSLLEQFKVEQYIVEQWQQKNKRETLKNMRRKEIYNRNDIEESDEENEECALETNEDHKVYIANTTFIKHPHHHNSLLYVQNKHQRPYYEDERFYWYFPKQHNHKEEVFVMRQSDYNRVNRHQWLNDEIVNFMIKYMYSSWPAHIKEKVYVFNTYFYTALKPIIKKKSDELPTKPELVKIEKQTRYYGNIFDREYIMIPICDGQHWVLAVIWRHNVVFKGVGHGNKCCIMILDSLNKKKEKYKDMFKVLERWLNLQSYFAGKKSRIYTSKSVLTQLIKVPQQPNDIDCGCFLLKNVLQLGKQIYANGKSIKWYTVVNGVGFRHCILRVMNVLMKEQRKYVNKLYQNIKEEKCMTFYKS